MGVTAEEPDYQKQFETAVSVIQGLPRNAPYRPSYEEMLRFYGYYKQATMGQCQIPKPGFWDPIGRYKWDAWNRLGKMTKEEAMAAYIEEMKKSAKKVINTVPMDKSSEDMFVYFEPLYEMIHDMPRPPEHFFKKKSVQPDSTPPSLPNGSLIGLAGHLPASGEHKQEEPSHEEEVVRSKHRASDSESEVFCDSLEQMEPDQARRSSANQSAPITSPHGFEAGEEDLQMAPGQESLSSSLEVIEDSLSGTLKQQKVHVQMTNTIRALQEDMKKVMERLSYLESLAALQSDTSILNPCRTTTLHDGKARPPSRPRWPRHLSLHTFLFLMAWPFVVQWLLWRFQSRKR